MRQKKKGWFKKAVPYLFLPAGILILFISSASSGTVEFVYSDAIYRYLGQFLSSVTGILPFSLAELILLSLVIMVLWMLIRTIIMLFHPPIPRWRIVLGFLSKLFIGAGIIYFTFILVWGLNYQRLPFANIASMDVKSASVDELAAVCDSIINKANQLRTQVNTDKNGVMHIDGGYADVFNRAAKGYEKAALLYPTLGGNFGKPKPFLPSLLMSYAGISGVYFPFTGEANVNVDVPDSMLPASACHEMAHQRGFAREDEANYISYLACSLNPDSDFQYSGYLLALIHSMNALYSYDPARYDALSKKYSTGVKLDLDKNDEFWHSYEGPVQKISNNINDTYLKANMQNDGIYSYGRMVDLLIAEYRKKTGK